MSWSERVLLISIVLLTACGGTSADVTSCPDQAGGVLRYVDVFDGSAEELATLVPDSPGEKAGYWQLGYVYDAGRFVTLRCKYSDGKQLDIKVSKKIEKCSYRINDERLLAVACE